MTFTITSNITSVWQNINQGIYWFAVLLCIAKVIASIVRAWFLWLLFSIFSLSTSVYYFDMLVGDGRAETLCKAVVMWFVGSVLMVYCAIPSYKEKSEYY